MLHQLHWLPVRQRVDVKVIRLVFQSLTGQAPVYLADDCHLVSDSDGRQLRSANIPTREVPRSQTRFGDRSFSVAGPRLWNALPSTLQLTYATFDCFRRLLKTYLFNQCYYAATLSVFLPFLRFTNFLRVCMYLYICIRHTDVTSSSSSSFTLCLLHLLAL